jgi:hypothetical protein
MGAADGSFIHLPQDKGLAEYCGGLGYGGKTAAALVSLLYDVLILLNHYGIMK